MIKYRDLMMVIVNGVAKIYQMLLAERRLMSQRTEDISGNC